MKILSWQVQEYYNRYLELKSEISTLMRNDAFGFDDGIDEAEAETELDNKVKEFQSTLSNMKLHGIKMEDLIMLSIGIEPEDYN